MMLLFNHSHRNSSSSVSKVSSICLADADVARLSTAASDMVLLRTGDLTMWLYIHPSWSGQPALLYNITIDDGLALYHTKFFKVSYFYTAGHRTRWSQKYIVAGQPVSTHQSISIVFYFRSSAIKKRTCIDIHTHGRYLKPRLPCLT